MKKIKEFMKRKSLQKQMQIAFLMMTVVIALLLGGGIYMVSRYTIQNNYQKNFQYSLETSDNIINIQMNRIVDAGREILSNRELMETLSESRKNNSNYFTGEQENVIEKALSNVMLSDTFISQAAVIDMSGKMYVSRYNVGKTFTYIRDDILEKEWIEEAAERKGKEIFCSYNVLDTERGMDSFSMVKSLLNIDTGEQEGYLVFNIREQLLQNSFVSLPDEYESNCFFVLDNESGLAYFRGDEKYEKEIMGEYNDPGKWRNSFIFAETENALLGWKLVSGIKKEELLQDSKLIGLEIFTIIILVGVLGNILSRKISRRIYRPLNQLGEMIRQVGEGSRNLPQQFDDSEVGRIGNQFKEMVNNNLELREKLLTAQIKEKEAELMLLQSQINPHFLYNTLDSIYCRAIIERQDDIARMVGALAKIFRLSLNSGKRLIRVRNEIEHIQSYMEIQNIRFNNRFQLRIDIPEKVQNLFIMKLILQPFVENAMYHGLEPKIGEGSITIRAEKKGEELVFYITDNGVGIQDMQDVYRGYGVKNVMERIHLFYGEQYGVEFTSEYGKGTEVKIRVKAL